MKGESDMKVLAIGNSFSQDATTFLHQAAAAQGIALTAVNLYIGGCSLETHWKNWETDEAAYELQVNGRPADRRVSVREMLAEGGWDAVATQQASHDSGWLDTYEPFLTWLVSGLRRAVPGARLLLQETWAYEKGSGHWAFPRYRRDQGEMYERLRRNYALMAQKHGMELIPCGTAVQRVREQPGFRTEEGGLSLCRDGFHMSLDYGRYLLALVWLKTLCGADVTQNPYVPRDRVPADEALLRVIREQAERTCTKA